MSRAAEARRRGAIAATFVALVGCGAGDELDNSDDATSDANTCAVAIAFEPGTLVAGLGATVRANGQVLGAEGFTDFDWSVRFGGEDIATSDAAPDGRDVFFPAELPGVYEVVLDVPGCALTSASFNATAPGAEDVVYRLRVQPPAATGVPASERLVVVQGGADASVGTIALVDGIEASGSLTVGGAPTAGYLRLGPLASPGLQLETFAVSDGSFAAQVLAEPHSVLVVPDGAVAAPARLASWQPLSPDLALDAGQAVSVHVLDPAGAPLAGARVALVVDGVPSTAAVTGGDGTASVLARFDASATVAVTVVPGDDTPWPRLEGTVLAADLAQPVEVAYAAGLQARPLAGALLARDGAPVAAAAVMLVGEHAQAGQVTIGGAEASALGRTLRSGSTTALGELVLAAPIAGTFELALRDALGAAVVAVDSQLAAPTNLAVAAPRTLTATVVGPDGAPLAGVRGTAVASGALAALAPSSRSTLADADGVLRWDDAPGGRWDVVLDDPSARVGRVELLAQLGPTLGTAAMPAAVHLEGKVTRAAQGTAVAGAVVTLLCSDCEGIGAARPIAVAVTSAVGGFRLAVPDPGTGGR